MGRWGFSDALAKEYMLHIIEQLADKCDEED